MYHTIEFVESVVLDLETSRRQPLERVAFRRGIRLAARVRPYVVEQEDGPAEVADLFFADGTATRGVPFAFLTFKD